MGSTAYRKIAWIAANKPFPLPLDLQAPLEGLVPLWFPGPL